MHRHSPASVAVLGGSSRRLRLAFLVLECVAQVVVCLGMVRIELERPAVAGDSFCEHSLVAERVRQIDVSCDLLGIQLHCAALAVDCFG